MVIWLVAVISSLVMGISASAEDGQSVLNENFNAMTTGLAPSGWNMDDLSGGSATVENFPSGTNKSVKLTDTSSTNPVIISKWLNSPSGILTVEFDISPAQTGDFIAAGYLLDAAGNRSVRVFFNNTTNEIQVYNGTSVQVVQTYAANTWYKMKYVLNTFTSKFDVYVNGVLKKSNVSFYEGASGVAKIQFFSGVPSGSVYIDNVSIRTGGILKLASNRVFEAYDDQTSGSSPSSWTLEDTSGGSVTVASEPSAADHSVKLNDTSTSNAVIASRSFTASTGKLTVEFDIQPGQTGTFIAAGYVMDSAGNRAVRAFFDNLTNEFKTYSGSSVVSVMPYEAGKWYRIKYVVDAAADKYDIHVNGRIVKSGLTFNSAGASSLSKVQFSIGATTAGSALIDNLNVAAEGSLESELYGSTVNLTGDEVGGGEGYSRSVNSWTTFVSTGSQLATALSTASSGDIIYIDDAADINMTALTLPLEVPGGVTLASGRGKINNGVVSTGARLYGTAPGKSYLKVMGNNVRFTGLYLDGGDYNIGTDPYIPAITTGIEALLYPTTEVDNNEIKGFSYGGVSINDGYVHHNYIHLNRRTGLGYGIVQNQ
jgi:hypothetical protein